MTIQSENGPENCIIDCNADGRAFIFQSGEDTDTIIDGFMIFDGNSATDGGAIVVMSDDCLDVAEFVLMSEGVLGYMCPIPLFIGVFIDEGYC